MVGFHDPAGQDRTIWSEPLPDDLETQLIYAGERGQVRAAEGSVRHVEVFRMGSVRTPIIGRPRPLSGHRRAASYYTLNCEEPVFPLGSVLVASSWNVEALIAFRVLQGFAGAFVQPASMTLILGSAPPNQRGRLLAMIGLPLFIGPIVGPILGGWLLDTLSWRWMFLINVPLGLLGIAAGLRNLPPTAGTPSSRLDVRGLFLLPPALALLVLGASFAQGPLLAPEVLYLLALGLVLVGLFIRHALRSQSPLLDVRLLGRRLTGGGAGVLFFFVGGHFVSTLLMPLYWQVVRGESATAAGLLMAPAGIAAALTMQVSGRLIDRLAPLPVIGSGITIAVLANAALALQLSADAPAWRIVVTSMIATVGASCTLMPTTTVATRSLEATAIPSGSTIIGVLNQVSAAIFTATVSVLLASQLSHRLPGFADDGVGSLNALAPAELAVIAPQVADSFRVAFWLATGLITIGGLIAFATLRVSPLRQESEQSPAQGRPGGQTVSEQITDVVRGPSERDDKGSGAADVRAPRPPHGRGDQSRRVHMAEE